MIIPALISESPIFNWALEAISHQVNSKFPEELSTEFEKVFDFAHNYDSEYGKPKDKEDASRKHNDLSEYISEHTAPNLKKIISKYTNIDVDKIVLLPSTDISMYSLIFCSVKDIDSLLIKLMNRANNTTDDNTQLSVMTNKKLANILDMSYNLDRSKGRINLGYAGMKSSSGSVGSSEGLHITLGFSPALFVLDELIIDGEKFIPTPKEITAILLHEIGHVFSWIEYVADLSFAGYYGNNVLRAVNDKFKKDPGKTLDEVADFLAEVNRKKDIPDKLLKLSENLFTLTTELQSRMKDAMSSSKLDISDIHNVKDLVYQGSFNILIKVILFGIIQLLTALGILYVGSITSILLPLLSYTSTNSSGSRNRGIDYNAASMFERLADEYVSRYQMSKHLNSGLTKLTTLGNQIFKLYHLGPITGRILRESSILKLYVVIFSLPTSVASYLLGITLEDYSNYESDYKRARRNINNMRDLLKNSSLPHDVRNDILNDIDKMNFDLNRVKPRLYRMTSYILKSILLMPGKSLRKILSRLFGDNNVDPELRKVAEDIDELLSNKAIYYAAKIQSIFEIKS